MNLLIATEHLLAPRRQVRDGALTLTAGGDGDLVSVDRSTASS